jgi:microcystin-dependent protein
MPYAGATSPEGWLLCNGAAVSRTTYANLFALIGTTYGSGDGTTTFNVPDMRSRMPIGAGSGTGLTTRALAATGGAESVVIASSNLPTHVHSVDPPNTTSTGVSANHSHGVDPPNTGSGGHSADHSHGTGTGSADHEHRLYFVTDAGSGTARARVSASGTSLSNTGITNFAGADHTHFTGATSANHIHYTDIGAFDTGGHSVDHTHNTNIDPFNSGDGGFANTALGLMNPFLAINYIIKY